MKAANIWRRLREEGKIDRLPYLAIGIFLFPLKYIIDFTVASVVFHRFWSPWDYVVSGSTITTLMRVPEDRAFFLALLGMSIPFVAVGVTLTMARLRDMGMSCFLALVFFLPVLNLIFFLVLSVQKGYEAPPPFAAVAPDGQEPAPPGGPVLSYDTDGTSPAGHWLQQHTPTSPAGSFWLATFVTLPLILVMNWTSVSIFNSYGWGIFVGMPFTAGLVSSVLFGLRERRTLAECLGIAAFNIFFATLAMFAIGSEGAGCLIMYLPLSIPIAMIGAAVGYALQKGPLRHGGVGGLLGALILFMPTFMGAEWLAHPAAPVFAVTTSVDIDAPPEQVWRNVVSFPQLPAPTELYFRIGVAYPIRAHISGQGVGAIRQCVFSTGTFVEPITVWDEPRLLKFDVTSNPPAMQEWSPYDIQPPHVRDFLISHGGEFRLVPLAGGRTRLVGTTWYEHNLWPAEYWRLWSDYLIHHIHLRVLGHIKHLSESGGHAAGEAAGAVGNVR